MNNKPGHVSPLATAKKSINEDEMLKCGMTIKEYNDLPEEEREKLWRQAYQHQLKIIEPEVEVNPNVLSPRQRRRPEDGRRLEQLRKRQSAHARSARGN